MSINKPNFVIVGAAKCGTTALYHYLAQHPEVFVSPKKETNYFALADSRTDYYEYYAHGDISVGQGNLVDTLDKYTALFKGAEHFSAVGEASPWYLFDPQVPTRIHNYRPDMKIIMILRDPADRAYSEFVHYIRDGQEPYPFEDFLKAFDEGNWRTENGWHPHWNYAQKGFYAKQLAHYRQVFPEAQLKVYLYEDLRTNQAGIIRDLFSFIGVNPDFQPDTSLRYNVTGLPKNRQLQDFLKRPHFIKKLIKPFLSDAMRHKLREKVEQRNLERMPPMTTEQRQYLVNYYREDVQTLEQMLNRDLSAWKQ